MFLKFIRTKIVQFAVAPPRIIKTSDILKNTIVTGLKIFITNISFGVNTLLFDRCVKWLYTTIVIWASLSTIGMLNTVVFKKSLHTIHSIKMRLPNMISLNLRQVNIVQNLKLSSVNLLTTSRFIRNLYTKGIFNTSKNSSFYTKRAVLFYERESH